MTKAAKAAPRGKVAAGAEGEMRIEYVELGALRKYPGNPKLHDLEAIGESFEAQGYVDPIVIDERSGLMAAGHGRLEKLEALRAAGEKPPKRIVVKDGKWHVPVLRGVRFDSDEALRKYVVASNRLVELGGWDNKELARLLSSLEGNLGGTGFDDSDLVRFLALSKAGQTPEERAEVFDNATTKQIVLYFDGKEYEDVVQRLVKVMEVANVDSNTAALMYLLEQWEKGARASRPKKAARG